MLTDQSDSALDGVGRTMKQVGDLFARNPHAPDILGIATIQNIKKRGFARAILADDRVKGSGLNGEMDAFVGDDTGKSLGDVFNADDCGIGIIELERADGIRHRTDLDNGEFSSVWEKITAACPVAAPSLYPIAFDL